MSGGTIPYHLRENKAIDRNLFIELLARIGRAVNISDYRYIGFGGPFLEDFRALHAALRITKMISLEEDENVKKRQEFNCPAAFIELQKKTSGEFLREHAFDHASIVWFDYTKPKELYAQLSEFRDLISKLAIHDIARITLNANPDSLGSPSPVDETSAFSLHQSRLEKLKERIGDLCELNINVDEVTQRNYPNTLQKAIHGTVSGLARRQSGQYFQVLSSFTYRDSVHQMLTVTGVVLDAKSSESTRRFLSDTRLDHWPFRNLDWSPPTNISVPMLSAKERLTLDTALPISDTNMAGMRLKDILGYSPADLQQSELLLANYAKYYRLLPMYSRVII
jgi:hypothetical protein